MTHKQFNIHDFVKLHRRSSTCLQQLHVRVCHNDVCEGVAWCLRTCRSSSCRSGLEYLHCWHGNNSKVWWRRAWRSRLFFWILRKESNQEVVILLWKVYKRACVHVTCCSHSLDTDTASPDCESCCVWSESCDRLKRTSTQSTCTAAHLQT